MRKKIIFVSMLIAAFILILAACTATPTSADLSDNGSASSGGDSSSSGSGDNAVAPAQGESSYDTIMKLLDDPSGALAFSGLQPPTYDSRESINKGLPVQPKPASEIKIGWSSASLGSEFFEAQRDYCLYKADQFGMPKPDLQNADFSLETQQNHIDTFITNKVDVMLVNCIDIYSEIPYYQKAIDAGIPVLTTGPTPATPDIPIITNVIPSSFENGVLVGKYCAEKLYKKGEVLKVGMLLIKLDHADSHARPCGWIAGFLLQSAEMDGHPYASEWDAYLEAYNIWSKFKDTRKYDLSEKGLNLVQMGIADNTDAASAQQASVDVLAASPDMDLFLVEADSMAIGALAEMRQQGIEPGKDMKVATFADGTVTSLDMIISGDLMCTAANNPYLTAGSIMDIIYGIFADPDQPAYNQFANNLPANSIMPPYIVNTENVQQYYPAFPDDKLNKFATFDPWVPLSIPQYNAQNG